MKKIKSGRSYGLQDAHSAPGILDCPLSPAEEAELQTYKLGYQVLQLSALRAQSRENARQQIEPETLAARTETSEPTTVMDSEKIDFFGGD